MKQLDLNGTFILYSSPQGSRLIIEERRSGGCQETGGSDARAGEAVAMATAGGDVRGRAQQPPETAGAPCRARATLLWPTN